MTTMASLARALRLLDNLPRACRLCGQLCTQAIRPKGTNVNTYVCASCAQDLPVELLAGEEDA